MNSKLTTCHFLTFRFSLLTAVMLSAFSGAYAQTLPDAGQTLLQQAPVLQPPKPAQNIRIERSVEPSVKPGGAQLTLQSISIIGTSVFSEEQLIRILGDIGGKSYDLAGLQALAERISAYYRANGYPFANAVIPAQTAAAGILRVEVIEGKYGQVQATGETDLAKQAQTFLQSLKPGQVIDTASLERATLLLDDLPGLIASPIIRPGQAAGTGDLGVAVQLAERYMGSVALDNHGNRYTGRARASFNLVVNSPFFLGDQISTGLQSTEQSLWFGNLGYSLPIGGSGLRAQIAYSRTSYELGKEFSALQATGTATVTSTGISHPLVRSQKANLNLSANWVAKSLEDRQGQTGTSISKSSDSLPLVLAFDRRDSLGTGGITYGSLAYTSGTLRLDKTAAVADAATAKSNGQYAKANLDIARIQALTSAWSLLGRASAQWADKNLDSSEKMSLGGPNAVRAYPVGEASGDEGWMAQVELRYQLATWSPYLFADSGETTTNSKPWIVGNNKRAVSGAGIGSRYSRGGWNIDAVLAWRTYGGKSLSDPQAGDPQGWLTIGYRY